MLKKLFIKYQEELKKCLNDLKYKETFYKQIPNLITVSRPLGMIPANILFFTGNHLAAVILTALLLSTDFIDGKLARHWKVESKLGADLDAVGDKIIFLGMALPLIVSNPLFILNVLFELAISYVNIKGRVNDLDIKTVYSGKVKTCFLSVTLLAGYLARFFGLPLYIFRGLILGTGITQGITLHEYTSTYAKMKKQNIKEYTENKTEKEKTEEHPKSKTRTKKELKEALIKEKDFLLSSKDIDKKTKKKQKIRKK